MWLDWLRVPSACVDGPVDGDEVVITWRANGRRLAWPRAHDGPAYELHALDGIPFYARRVASESPAWASESETIATVTRAGAPVAFVRRAADGSIFLPFDPDDAIRALQTESYVSAASRRDPRVCQGSRATRLLSPASPDPSLAPTLASPRVQPGAAASFVPGLAGRARPARSRRASPRVRSRRGGRAAPLDLAVAASIYLGLRAHARRRDECRLCADRRALPGGG